MATTVRNVKLWFCRGTSDKTYELLMTSQDGWYTVTVYWGRRGKTQQEQVKVSTPSSIRANCIYDKIMAEKLQKGYTSMTAPLR